jgi:GTP cyclohydrolase I
MHSTDFIFPEMEIKHSNAQADENSLILHQHNVKELLRFIGDDTEREGLKETPKRFVQFLKEFTSPEPFKMTTFENEGGDDLIVQTDIPFYSLCEHHLAPFFGTASVAYLPKGRIVGLSKLARTVQHFSRQFQNQERITKQIADLIEQELKPSGVGVVLKARHLCMEMRGIEARGAQTITSRMTGAFFKNPAARAEFLSIINP